MIDPADQGHNEKGQPGVTQAALFGMCPCCGTKGLWAAPGQFAERCKGCGLEFGRHELKGRGAYVVVFPLTLLLILAALKLDEAVRLPALALVTIWPLLVAGTIVTALRWAKAAVLVARGRD